MGQGSETVRPVFLPVKVNFTFQTCLQHIHENLLDFFSKLPLANIFTFYQLLNMADKLTAEQVSSIGLERDENILLAHALSQEFIFLLFEWVVGGTELLIFNRITDISSRQALSDIFEVTFGVSVIKDSFYFLIGDYDENDEREYIMVKAFQISSNGSLQFSQSRTEEIPLLLGHGGHSTAVTEGYEIFMFGGYSISKSNETPTMDPTMDVLNTLTLEQYTLPPYPLIDAKIIGLTCSHSAKLEDSFRCMFRSYAGKSNSKDDELAMD